MKAFWVLKNILCIVLLCLFFSERVYASVCQITAVGIVNPTTIRDCTAANGCDNLELFCPNTQNCIFLCHGAGSCTNTIMHCPTDFDCQVNCAGSDSCFNAIIYGPSSAMRQSDLLVGCSGTTSCSSLEVYAPGYWGNLQITCNPTVGYACFGMNILCSGTAIDPNSAQASKGLCQVSCRGGDNGGTSNSICASLTMIGQESGYGTTTLDCQATTGNLVRCQNAFINCKNARECNFNCDATTAYCEKATMYCMGFNQDCNFRCVNSPSYAQSCSQTQVQCNSFLNNHIGCSLGLASNLGGCLTDQTQCGSICPVVTASVSFSKTISITPTRTPTISVTRSRTPTISVTSTKTPTISITGTKSVTASVTETSTPTITATPSSSITETVTPSTSITETVSITLSSTTSPTNSVLASETHSISVSHSVSPTISVSKSANTVYLSCLPPGQTTKIAADLVEMYFFMLQNDIYGGYDRAFSFSAYRVQEHKGICYPNLLDETYPGSSTSFHLGFSSSCACDMIVDTYASEICSNPSNCTLMEMITIAENLTISASVLSFNITGDWLTNGMIEDRFLQLHQEGIVALEEFSCAARIYSYLHDFCRPGVFTNVQKNWGITTSQTIVKRHGSSMAPSTILLEDFDPDLDRNDQVFLKLYSCLFNLNTFESIYYLQGCNMHYYYLARGGGYKTSLIFNYNGNFNPLPDTTPTPQCRSQKALLNNIEPSDGAPIFNYTIASSTDQLGSINVMRHYANPSDYPYYNVESNIQKAFECYMITMDNSTDLHVLPAHCSTVRNGDDVIIIRDTMEILPETPETLYTNTMQNTTLVMPLFAVTVRYDFARPAAYHSLEDVMDMLPRIMLRNEDCKIDVQLYDNNQNFTDPNNVPYGIVVDGPSFIMWNKEGLPTYPRWSGSGQCVHGEDSGETCTLPRGTIQCPVGFCVPTREKCYGGVRHGQSCQSSSDQCPFAIDCYDGIGTYPNVKNFFDCKKLGCYGPVDSIVGTTSIDFPIAEVVQGCPSYCYDRNTFYWNEYPTNNTNDLVPFPFEWFIPNPYITWW